MFLPMSVSKKHIRDHGFSMYYDIRRHNNYIEHDTNTASTSNELDIASTSNKPAEDVGPTKDDLEGLFEMANEELFPAKHMTWHATGKCNEDGKMGHPVDGKAWKEFDNNNADLAKEPRNSSFMLTLLIPGPKSPGKDIDVYLKPLVEELKNLWKKPGTINDFPARSSLSGWSGQGYFAYPTCNDETPATRVNGKTAYVGHRRFLPMKHRWTKLKTFNGENKNKPTLPKLDSAQILRQLSRSPSCILGTLLMNNKSKDTNKARQDLKELLIRNELWLAKKGNGKFLKPHPKFMLEVYVSRTSWEPNEPVDQNIMAHFEKIYPLLLFFDIMIHLVMHLPVEAILVNGVKFVVHIRDQCLTTQCSGVSTPSDKDGAMYYGVLEEILELDYLTLDDADVIHDNMSSDLALTANLEDLDHTSLNVPHDFSSDSDSDSKDLDNQRVMALVQGRGHGGDNGPSNDDVPWQPPSECKKNHLKRSRSSKVNRSKQLYSSNQGTKSYAQSRYEEFNEETGVFPDFIDYFRAKHMKGANGTA
ncbi:RNA-directed DNA polymerase [Tanacetum coccineum]